MIIQLLLLLFFFPYSAAQPPRPLEGLKLRCCTVHEAPIITRDVNKHLNFSGLGMEYFDLLQDRLGFQCKTFQEYSNEDTSFTSFIYYMSNCTRDGEIPPSFTNCTCDIGIAGFGMNEERNGLVQFVQPFLSDPHRVATHVDYTHSKQRSTFFLTAFSFRVWIAVLSLIVLFTFLKMLDRRFSPPDQSYTPLSRDSSTFRRLRHYLLKSKVLFRLRKALMSTRKLISSVPFSKICFILNAFFHHM